MYQCSNTELGAGQRAMDDQAKGVVLLPAQCAEEKVLWGPCTGCSEIVVAGTALHFDEHGRGFLQQPDLPIAWAVDMLGEASCVHLDDERGDLYVTADGCTEWLSELAETTTLATATFSIEDKEHAVAISRPRVPRFRAVCLLWTLRDVKEAFWVSS